MNIAEKIKEFCEEKGDRFYEDYSGRCMYGRTCVGVVTEDSAISLTLDLLVYLVENEMDLYEAKELLQFARTDRMGYDTIVYFPRINSESEG